MKRRPLSDGELKIFRMIQEEHGAQNTEQDVFFTEAGEAGIFIKARDGTSPTMVVLTNLAAWRADGTIASDEALRREWLRAGNPELCLLHRWLDLREGERGRHNARRCSRITGDSIVFGQHD